MSKIDVVISKLKVLNDKFNKYVDKTTEAKNYIGTMHKTNTCEHCEERFVTQGKLKKHRKT